MTTVEPRVLVLAHRGDARRAPENSMAAFEAALDTGADGCETDVRLAADGALVLVHDRRVPDGREVAALTREELSVALGHEVPTVEEVLERWPEAFWNLEVKDPAAAAHLLLVVERQDPDVVLVTSFDHTVAAGFGHASEASAGVLIAHRPLPGTTPFAAWRRAGIVVAVAPLDLLDAAFVTEAAAHDIAVGTWGIGSASDHAHALALGATLLITDTPS